MVWVPEDGVFFDEVPVVDRAARSLLCAELTASCVRF